mgnify:CR=1 FL=1
MEAAAHSSAYHGRATTCPIGASRLVRSAGAGAAPQFVIPDADKEVVRQNILEAMIRWAGEGQVVMGEGRFCKVEGR